MIDKNIPMPDRVFKAHDRKEYRSKYYWRKCKEVGDSFVARDKNPERVYSAARKFCQRNPEFKFHIEQQEDGAVRVWRVK